MHKKSLFIASGMTLAGAALFAIISYNDSSDSDTKSCEEEYTIVIKNVQKDRPIMREQEVSQGGEILSPYYYEQEDAD